MADGFDVTTYGGGRVFSGRCSILLAAISSHGISVPPALRKQMPDTAQAFRVSATAKNDFSAGRSRIMQQGVFSEPASSMANSSLFPFHAGRRNCSKAQLHYFNKNEKAARASSNGSREDRHSIASHCRKAADKAPDAPRRPPSAHWILTENARKNLQGGWR